MYWYYPVLNFLFHFTADHPFSRGEKILRTVPPLCRAVQKWACVFFYRHGRTWILHDQTWVKHVHACRRHDNAWLKTWQIHIYLYITSRILTNWSLLLKFHFFRFCSKWVYPNLPPRANHLQMKEIMSSLHPRKEDVRLVSGGNGRDSRKKLKIPSLNYN